MPDGLETNLSGLTKFLADLDFDPRTAIHISLGNRISSVQNAYGDAQLYMVDPLVSAAAGRGSAQVHAAAAMSETGDAALYLDSNVNEPTLSEPDAGVFEKLRVRAVPVDELLQDEPLRQPVLMRVAMAGTELDALHGASATLKQVELLVVRIGPWAPNRPTTPPEDVIALLRTHGFVPYAIFDQSYAVDGHLSVVEMAFVPAKSVFRNSNNW